jgi:hypothetical protein
VEEIDCENFENKISLPEEVPEVRCRRSRRRKYSTEETSSSSSTKEGNHHREIVHQTKQDFFTKNPLVEEVGVIYKINLVSF